VDKPETIFRTRMSEAMQAHLEIRDDVREMAQFIEPRYREGGTVVVNGVHGFDYYFPHTAYFFVDIHDPNFPDWSCRRGSVDRWTNLPLIKSWDDLARAHPAERIYVVTFTPAPEDLEHLTSRHVRVVMKRGLVWLLELSPA
jgi:hypothetical protein